MVEWFKEVGDSAAEDEAVMVLETDKISMVRACLVCAACLAQVLGAEGVCAAMSTPTANRPALPPRTPLPLANALNVLASFSPPRHGDRLGDHRR